MILLLYLRRRLAVKRGRKFHAVRRKKNLAVKKQYITIPYIILYTFIISLVFVTSIKYELINALL